MSCATASSLAIELPSFDFSKYIICIDFSLDDIHNTAQYAYHTTVIVDPMPGQSQKLFQLETHISGTQNVFTWAFPSEWPRSNGRTLLDWDVQTSAFGIADGHFAVVPHTFIFHFRTIFGENFDGLVFRSGRIHR